MPRRTQVERAAASTKSMVDATIGLIAERGVDGFSIADMAERAGVSRGLPVHHFKTRDALLLEVAKVVAKPCGSPLSFGLDALLGWYKTALRDAQDPSPELRALMALLTARALPKAVEKHVGAFLEVETEIARRHLEAGVTERTIRRPLDPAAHAKVLAAAMAGQIALAVRLGLSDAQVDDFIAMLSAELRSGGDRPRTSRAETQRSVPREPVLPGLFDKTP